jgi:hypothetical protein
LIVCIICLQEFVIGLSVISRGSDAEKLDWIFNLYDINGIGMIQYDDMLMVVESVYELIGASAEPSVQDACARVHAAHVFDVRRLHASNNPPT